MRGGKDNKRHPQAFTSVFYPKFLSPEHAAPSAAAQVAALWLVGKIALVGVGAAFFIVLFAVLMKD